MCDYYGIISQVLDEFQNIDSAKEGTDFVWLLISVKSGIYIHSWEFLRNRGEVVEMVGKSA